MPGTKNVHKQQGKGIDYREVGDKYGVGVSTACKKVDAAGTDENLFRLVPVPGHGARVTSGAMRQTTVESRFLELPMETKIGSRNREVCRNRG